MLQNCGHFRKTDRRRWNAYVFKREVYTTPHR